MKTTIVGLAIAVISGAGGSQTVQVAGPTKTAAAVTVKTDSSVSSSASSVDASTAATKKQPEKLRLTLEQLAQYNGQDGRPAYIAVDGVIYDVTKAKGWKNGKHKGFSAGKDVSNEIRKKSPHGDKVLKKIPVVGVIVSSEQASEM